MSAVSADALCLPPFCTRLGMHATNQNTAHAALHRHKGGQLKPPLHPIGEKNKNTDSREAAKATATACMLNIELQDTSELALNKNNGVPPSQPLQWHSEAISACMLPMQGSSKKSRGRPICAATNAPCSRCLATTHQRSNEGPINVMLRVSCARERTSPNNTLGSEFVGSLLDDSWPTPLRHSTRLFSPLAPVNSG